MLLAYVTSVLIIATCDRYHRVRVDCTIRDRRLPYRQRSERISQRDIKEESAWTGGGSVVAFYYATSVHAIIRKNN